MNLFDLKIENWYTFVIEINWAIMLILVFALWLVTLMVKICIGRVQKHSIIVNEIELGIGNSNIK